MKTKYFNIFIIATIGRLSLKEAINSALNQKHDTLIVVVFDDEDIVKMVDHSDVVYLKTDQHVWGEGARQYGIDWCIANNIKSTYLSYLDDDDIILPSYTESLEKFNTWDIIIHSMKIFEIATQPLVMNYVGLTYSLKWEKAKHIKWSSVVPPDFNYINNACKSGLSHFKTGVISYHQLTRGLTGSHTNVKYGRHDSSLNK